MHVNMFSCFYTKDKGTVLKAVNYDGEMFIIEEVQIFHPRQPIKILKFSNITVIWDNHSFKKVYITADASVVILFQEFHYIFIYFLSFSKTGFIKNVKKHIFKLFIKSLLRKNKQVQYVWCQCTSASSVLCVSVIDPRCTWSALCRLRHWSSPDTTGHLWEVLILYGLCSSQRPVLWLEQCSGEMRFHF